MLGGHARRAVDPMRFTEQTTNMPRVWARDGDSYVLRPIPDDTYAVRERVYEYPSSLSGDSSTNFATPLPAEARRDRGDSVRVHVLRRGRVVSALVAALFGRAREGGRGVDRRRLSPSRPTMKPGTGAGARVRLPERLRLVLRAVLVALMSDPDLIRALSDLTLAVRGGLVMTTERDCVRHLSGVHRCVRSPARRRRRSGRRALVAVRSAWLCDDHRDRARRARGSTDEERSTSDSRRRRL